MSKAGRYSESIKVIDEAIKKTVDEKLLCFQAENYYQINRFVDAEQAYFSACNMVPSRFFPKYFLMVFYINTRSNQKAIDIGKKILEMPEKKRDNQSIQIKLSTEFLIDSLTKIK